MAARRLVRESIVCLTKANLMRGRVGLFSSSSAAASTTTTTAPHPLMMKKLGFFSSSAAAGGGGSLSSRGIASFSNYAAAGMQTSSKAVLPFRQISSRRMLSSSSDKHRKWEEKIEEQQRIILEKTAWALDAAGKFTIYEWLMAIPTGLSLACIIVCVIDALSDVAKGHLPTTSSAVQMKSLVGDEK